MPFNRRVIQYVTFCGLMFNMIRYMSSVIDVKYNTLHEFRGVMCKIIICNMSSVIDV